MQSIRLDNPDEGWADQISSDIIDPDHLPETMPDLSRPVVDELGILASYMSYIREYIIPILSMETVEVDWYNAVNVVPDQRELVVIWRYQ